MELPLLFFKTILLRPYVFIFLGAFLFTASGLLGWKRTGAFLAVTWATAFLCEFSSTRTGIPFGWYYYTGSTVGDELYISNVPLMDSLSFSFLLFASYCMALFFLLPSRAPQARESALPVLVFDAAAQRSWPTGLLTVLFFVFIDVVIDPVALRGDRWFLGQIYGYPEPGIHFGVPIANYGGWAVVGLLSLTGYFVIDRRLGDSPTSEPDGAGVASATARVLMGCGLYYGVLVFNIGITFWIGEALIGTTGVLMFLPISLLFLLRLSGRLAPTSASGTH